MGKMKTLDEAIRQAVTRPDPILAARIAEKTRFRYGWDWQNLYDRAFKITRVSQADWDELIREGES